MIQAGDSVKHIPSGETWYLVGVSINRNKVCVAGWPPTVADLSDCVLTEKGNGINGEELEYRNKEFGANWD